MGDGQSAGKARTMFDAARVPSEIGWYIAGFTDGEGSFNISFRKRDDYKMPWKISLCFNVSQRDKLILLLFQQHLQCGTLRSREDGVWYYEVNDFVAIVENVIPFFDKFSSSSNIYKFELIKSLSIHVVPNNSNKIFGVKE